MLVITISRQLGSGGREVGNKVAEKLGIAYVDQEIVSRAAALADVSEEALSDADERRPTLLGHIADLLARYPAAVELGVPTVDIEPSLGQDTFKQLVEDVMREVAAKGSAVIVGRGGQMIFKDRPDTFHVHLYAPFEVRVRRTLQRERLSQVEAERRVRESDRNRSGYIRTYYKVDWQDPELYALMINTGKLDIDTVADLIATAAKSTLGDA